MLTSVPPMNKCSFVSGTPSIISCWELETEATEIVMVQKVALLGLRPRPQPWTGNQQGRVGVTWVWAEEQARLGSHSGKSADTQPQRLLVASSRGYCPHFLLWLPSALGSFPPMLQADPCKPGSWWLFGILGCGGHRKRQNKDAPNSACPSGSVAAAVAFCLHHCLPSLCLSVSLSLSTSFSPGLCLSLRQALLCDLRQTSFSLRASISPSGH